MSITHTEVRRHPRWKEQLGAAQTTPAAPNYRVRLIATVAVLIVATAILVIVNG